MSNFIAFSHAYGIKVYNPSFDEYANFFEKTRSQIPVKFPVGNNLVLPFSNPLRKITYRIIYKLVALLEKANFVKSFYHEIIDLGINHEMELSSSRFINIAKRKKVVFCKGWLFRDRKNFSITSNIIKSFFKPLDLYLTKVNATVKNARFSNGTILIGVHIRRGDYKNFLNGKYFFSLSFYLSCMHSLKKEICDRDIKFIICSNEEIDKNDFNDLDIILSSRHFVEDLYLLSACDYIIGPPSTFSMWASFYGNVPLLKLENEEQTISLENFTLYGK